MFIITVDIHGDSTPFSVAGRIYHITRWTDFGPRLLHPPQGVSLARHPFDSAPGGACF